MGHPGHHPRPAHLYPVSSPASPFHHKPITMNHTLLSSARIPATPAWRRWLRQPVGRGHWRRWPKFLALLYTLLAFAGLYNYLTLVSATTAIGILALLYTPRLEKHPPETFRFGWVALFFIALFFLVPVTTTVYLALGCAACLLL